MSLGQFSRAKSILQEIYDALKEARAYRNEPETDAESDLRTIIDLIYCHMRQGNYDKAYEMYCNYYRDKTGKEAPIQIDKNFLDGVKKSRRVAGINNLISCCMLATNEVGEAQERLRTAEDAFKYLLEYCNAENFNKNPEINLLRGYFVLLTGRDPLNKIDRIDNINNITTGISHLNTGQTRASKNKEDTALELAHEYFKLACGYQYGFSPIYHLTLDGKEPDRAYLSNHAVYISAYLISLIRLAEKQSAEKQRQSISTVANVANALTSSTASTASTASIVTSKDYEAEIKQCLLGMPKRYELTLNAAIALAEWLLEHEKRKR